MGGEFPSWAHRDTPAPERGADVERGVSQRRQSGAALKLAQRRGEGDNPGARVQRQPAAAATSTDSLEAQAETASTAAVAGAAVGPLSPAAPDATPEVRRLLVADEADAAPGQMRRTDFLAALREAVCTAAIEILGPETVGDCPELDRWFGYYMTVDPGQIERTIARYAPDAAGAASAAAYVAPIVARVRRSVVIWAATGRVTGIPGGATGEPGGVSAAQQPFLKSRGARRAHDDPGAIRAGLMPGVSLDSGVRTRMEASFGRSFENVRVHADTEAARVAQELDARAFTVGDEVAFAAGEYRPGSLGGDALIAHELAHTVQQSGGTQGGDSGLETEASGAALAALAGRRASVVGGTGLGLQRCKSSTKAPDEAALRARKAELDAVIKDAPARSFGAVAAAITERADIEHDLLVKQRGYGTVVGTHAPTLPASSYPAGAPERSDCTIFTRSMLRDTFRAQGKDADWQKVSKKWMDLDGQTKGTTLQQALQSELGWKGVFWAPDPTHDPDPEHPAAARKARETGKYYGVDVETDKSVVGYRTVKGVKSEPENLVRLRKVNFGVLSARGGMHMAVIVRGTVYEVHWDQPASSPRVIDATALTDFAWLSGSIVMPPDELTDAWK